MFSIAMGSCENRWSHAYGAYPIVNMLKCKAFFALGDMPYTNQGATCWGTTTTQVDVSTTQSGFELLHAQSRANPGIQYLLNNLDYYYMADDHEWGGNDWDHTLTQANNGAGSIGASTEAEVDAHWLAGNLAVQTYSVLNPTNTDTEAVAEKPSDAEAGTSVDNYPVRYFRVGYDIDGARNDAAPFAEFFVTDCISYRDPIAQLDDASKTMLGANQKAWLKARLLASTATFKVILSKAIIPNAANNSDDWSVYSTEAEEILDYIEANVTGVAWLCGDRHCSRVDQRKTADAQAQDHVSVVCAVWSKEGVAVTQDNVETIYADTRRDGTKGWAWAFSGITFHADKMELFIRDALDGSVMWRGYVLSGENKLSYPAVECSI